MSDAQPTSSTPAQIDREFPCAKCGAKLVFAPGTTNLRCEYCGHENQIAISQQPVEELDFDAALSDLAGKQESEDRIVCHCDSCGADVPMKPGVTSQACPFCGTPIVAEALSKKLIRPRSLLPFAITRQQAQALFERWLSSLWWAPSNLKKFAAVDGKLAGMYIPYWTYDARAVTPYTGERGDDYWDTQTYMTTVNGKPTMRTRQVRRTRWRSVSGVVNDRFDDVLVAASSSLPHEKLEALGDWDTKALVPYTDEFLSGFGAESYTVDLKEGFGRARLIIEDGIRATIRSDIGGDHQRIHSMSPRYSGITFKHILVPIWIAAYRYSGNSYRFLVNGRTGTVSGDRPYSWRKITLAVVTAVIVIGIVAIVIAVSR